MREKALNPSLQEQIEALEQLTTLQLQMRYREVFGEDSRSNHKQFLYRRIAWRLQANVEGGLSERAMRRAMEIANDADLRIRGPRNFLKKKLDQSRIVVTKIDEPDPRLPPSGHDLVRRFRGKDIRVRVRAGGFEYEGRIYSSLSAAVREATGTRWNGFTFFGLGEKPGRKNGEHE